MRKRYLLLLIGIILLPISTFATSGRLLASSITSCNGQNYGKHGDGHWHRAVKEGNYWYADGEPLSGNPCANNSYTPPAASYNSNSQSNYSNNSNTQNSNNNYTNAIEEPVVVKSSDTSLREIKIEGNSIDLDNLKYETDKGSINIEVIANDEKTTLTYDKNVNLSNGGNKIVISAVAENGDKKEYEININKIVKSSNKEFKIFYKDEELKINSFDKTIEEFSVEYGTENMKFTYSTTDKNAKIKITGNKNLKVGSNNIKVKVIAEDGSSETYTLKVNRFGKIATVLINVLAVIVMIFIFVCPIWLLVKFIKKIKKKI